MAWSAATSGRVPTLAATVLVVSADHPMPTDAAHRRAFLAAFLRRPGTMGAVVPSSARLSAVLTSIVPTIGTPVVVELGPGTGAVSAVIDERLPRGARHLAVELDGDMVEFLGRTRPGLEVVHGDARDLGKLLAERGVLHVDTFAGFAVSSLSTSAGSVISPCGTSIVRTFAPARRAISAKRAPK